MSVEYSMKTEATSASSASTVPPTLYPGGGVRWRSEDSSHADISSTNAISLRFTKEPRIWESAFTIHVNTVASANSFEQNNVNATYTKLYELVRAYRALDEDEANWIDEQTYNSACSVLAMLAYHFVDAPKLFSHGGDAVALVWERQIYSLYVTISEGSVTLSARILKNKPVIIASWGLSEEGGARGLLKYLRVRSDAASTNAR